MSAANALEDRVSALAKASRTAAMLSVIGVLIVFVAIGYAIVQLRTLEDQRDVMLEEQRTLKADTERVKNDLVIVRSDLAKARASLSASRAAINAFHAGHLQDAVALYNEALASDPDNAYIQNLRAYALFRLGDVQAALEGQRRSIAADPGYAWGYFDLARFLCAAKPPRLDEARSAAAKAIELRPDMRAIMQHDREFQRVCGHQVP